MKITKELGSILLTRRKELGLTQRALAKECGLSDVTISYLERGETETSEGSVISLLWALKVPPMLARRLILSKFPTGTKITDEGGLQEPNGLTWKPDQKETVVLPRGYRLTRDEKDRLWVLTDGESGTVFQLIPGEAPGASGRMELSRRRFEEDYSNLKFHPAKLSWTDDNGIKHHLPKDGSLPEGTLLIGGNLVFPGQHSKPIFTDEETRLVYLWRKIRPEDRAAAYRMLEGLVAAQSPK